ncbi:MAG: ABC transporter substrate-binding protein [Enterococcus sp.]
MKKLVIVGGLLGVSLAIAGCGTSSATSTADTKTTTTTSETAKKQSLTYLDKKYEVTYPTNKIVTASLESMEDAVALGVEPIGAVAVSTDFPSYLKDDLGSDVQNVGNKMGPDVEAVTALAPDVILGSTKFDESVTANLNKIAPTINVSHQSTDWAENLELMGELSGKSEEAEEKVDAYNSDLKAFKKEHAAIKDQKAVMVRVRNGELCVYGEKLYYNPTIYGDLGYQIPDELKDVSAQTTISVEQFADWDVDVVFVQFDEEENAGNLDYLDKLKENTIWQSIPAVANNDVYYNVVDGGYQGGTYLSKEALLEGLNENL